MKTKSKSPLLQVKVIILTRRTPNQTPSNISVYFLDNLNKLKLEQVSALTSFDFRGFPVDAIFFLKFANEQIKHNFIIVI